MVLAALGVALLLDEVGVYDLSFAVLGPLVCAVAGAILLAVGLSRSP
jgi:hypothetical protein